MRESVKICIRANCLKNNNISVTQPTLRRLCQCDYNKYVVSQRRRHGMWMGHSYILYQFYGESEIISKAIASLTLPKLTPISLLSIEVVETVRAKVVYCVYI